MVISSEALAYWFFRVNGFLTIVNFLVHPEFRRDSCTEVDILGVRFPYRRENIRHPMRDHEAFFDQDKRVRVVISEVKNGLCELNGPWIDPSKKNFYKVLRAIGPFPEKSVRSVAKSLQSTGFYSDKDHIVSIICIGERRNSKLTEDYPCVQQIIYDEILNFLYGRFSKYQFEKSQHDQWDSNGKKIWNSVESHEDSRSFVQSAQVQPPIR
jgi:hypothetical protein